MTPEEVLKAEQEGRNVPLPVFKSLIPKKYNDPDKSGLTMEILPKGQKTEIRIELQSK